MLESNEYIKALGSLSKYVPEFESLCKKYGLSSEQRYVDRDGNERGQYILLLDMYTRRKVGIYPTIEEIQADFSALDIARMLRQLLYLDGKSFSLNGQEYRNPTLGGLLIQFLTEALGKRVEKKESLNSSNPNYPLIGKPVMILSKGGSTGRAYIIPYPEGAKPQQKGFSNAELNAIIDYESKAREEWEKSQGNTERWEGKGKSRLPELGRMAQVIKDLLPLDWKVVDKHNFVAEYMRGAGFLDFKNEERLQEFDGKNRKQKDREVRNWLKAYWGV